MKDVLEELKGSISGVIGSFVIGEKGEVAGQDVPELMSGSIDKVSKTLHHVTNVITSTKPVDKMTIDSETAKLIILPANGRLLVVVAEKSINLPLFKLMSNMATSKIKEAPAAEEKPKEPEVDFGQICDVYDGLFGAAAKRLANIIGPKAATHFSEGAEEVIKKYPGVFGEVTFAKTGKPDIIKIRENTANVSNKDEFMDALDELLLSMLDSVKKTAGAIQEQKAMDEIQDIRSKQGRFL
jgi:predicted regulator of Ras-like GTPase activity (Roadblock/LC7/MglB family)